MLTSKIPQVRRSLKLNTAERVARVAEQMADDATRGAPVDEGDLRDSVDWEMVGPTEARVGVGEFYGHLVEFGTRHSAAQPFLIPAAEKARHSVARRFRGIV